MLQCKLCSNMRAAARKKNGSRIFLTILIYIVSCVAKSRQAQGRNGLKKMFNYSVPELILIYIRKSTVSFLTGVAFSIHICKYSVPFLTRVNLVVYICKCNESKNFLFLCQSAGLFIMSLYVCSFVKCKIDNSV